MICRTCHKENNENATYCAHCGEPLAVPGKAVATLRFGTRSGGETEPPAKPTAPVPTQEKKTTSGSELKSLLKDILSDKPKATGTQTKPHGTSPGGLPDHLRKPATPPTNAPALPNAKPADKPSETTQTETRTSPEPVRSKEQAPAPTPTERVAVPPLQGQLPIQARTKVETQAAGSDTFEGLSAAEPTGEFEFSGLNDRSDTGYSIPKPVESEDESWSFQTPSDQPSSSDTSSSHTKEQPEKKAPSIQEDAPVEVESFSSFVKKLRDPSPERQQTHTDVQEKTLPSSTQEEPSPFEMGSSPSNKALKEEPRFTSSSPKNQVQSSWDSLDQQPDDETDEEQEEEYEDVQVIAAGFSSRLLAGLIDHGIVFGIWLLALGLVSMVFGTENLPAGESGTFGLIALGLDYPSLLLPLSQSYLLLFAMLYLLFHCTTGQTPGKLVLGLRAIQTDGERIGFSRAVVRLIGYWVSLASAGLGLLWVLVDSKKQGFHDKLAGILVIRVQ